MDILDELLASPEPAVRYKVLANILGRSPESPEVKTAQEAVRRSERVLALLLERTGDGGTLCSAYSKWQGAHWLLSILADVGYPPADVSLVPLRDQTYAWLLSEAHWKKIVTSQGRVRRCASQEGNALYSTLMLGIADERVEQLAKRLLLWQWPDGGWNCDKHPEADTSSFMESLIPLRGLALHARLTGNAKS